MSHSTRKSARALSLLANEQGGYFTAKQAKEAGYDYPHLDYHVAAGNFERVDHGLYRLASVPRHDHDELIRLSLWSRNQKDEPQAVVSHESALALYDLSDLLPKKVHLTVPAKFRKPCPKGVVIHKRTLAPVDLEDRTGFRVTTPLRTLVDAAASDIGREQLEKAVTDALSRGLVQRKKLANALNGSRGLDRLAEIVGARNKLSV
jgi:predicted transcriptional regulator of viral defense system